MNNSIDIEGDYTTLSIFIFVCFKMKNTNVGFVGIGDHCCQSHIAPMTHIKNATVHALCDIHPSNIEAAINKKENNLQPDIKTYSSTEDFYADTEIDAVVISTPDRLHAEQLLEAVKHNKHVLVEKPLADTLDAMNKVTEAFEIAKSKGLVITSCHPRRFDQPFLWLKNNMNTFTKKFGEVLNFTCDFSYHKPSKTGLHSGMIDDHFNHEIDLTNFLFGITGFSATKLINEETRYAAAGERDDTISFFFQGSRNLDTKEYPEYFTVRFQKGDIHIHTKTGVCTINDHHTHKTSYETCGATDYKKRFLGVNQNFIDTIQGTAENYLTNTDMLINTQSGLQLTQTGRYDISAQEIEAIK